MAKILFIMYYYGDGFAAGNQNKRLIDSLSQSHFQYKVVCRYSLKNQIRNIVKIGSPKFKLLNHVIDKFIPGLNGVTSFDEFLWIIKVLIKLKKEKNNYEIIHVVSSPFLIQLLGYIFKTNNKTKWIVQLLDPVLDNTYIRQTKISLYSLKKMELFIVKNADLILFNNYRLINKFEKRYSKYKNKFKELPLITDTRIISNKEKNDKITLYHGGSLYGLRKIDFLVASLNELIKISNKTHLLEIHFFGNFSSEDRELVFKNKLEKIVFFNDYIEFNQLNALLSKADALLLIDALESEGVFTPSKLCEYFSFQKMIFAITPEQSVTSDFLQNSGHLCFGKGEERRFANEINNMLNNRDYFNGKFNKFLFENHLPMGVVEKYVELLTKV